MSSTVKLPIGVILPTRNARRFLAAHWAQLQSWAELVEEIIVVDSGSTDGTAEFLAAQSCHTRVRLLQHPPGLYQSWNFGIQQVTAPYVYISTVGDTITAEGLQHLAAVAEELRSDVVVSRPEFFAENGQPVPTKRWPAHEYLEREALVGPKVLEPMQTFLLSLLNVPEGVLGSSASNLYRTQTLQRLPFPTEYGHVGDTAWAIAYAFQASVAITPKVFSRFLIHPNGGQIADEEMDALKQRFFVLGRQTLQKAVLQGAALPEVGRLLDLLDEFSEGLRELRKWQNRYDASRHQSWPWILNPLAWQARASRNAQRRHLAQAKEALWQQFASGKSTAEEPPATTPRRFPDVPPRNPLPDQSLQSPETAPSDGRAHIQLSVLLCSHNPRPEHLERVLHALQAQTLPMQNWELLLIDSASAPPLAGRFDLSWHPHSALLREDEPGKTKAFLRGSTRAAAPVLVIVDDDNVLAADYLEQAAAIATAYPDLGAWGGNVTLDFEKPPPDWTRRYRTFLAEQTVAVASVVCNLELSQPLPVGAGCCVRKGVVRHYAARLAHSPWRQALGPTGTKLLRGEDTDLVLTACEMGLGRGLFPSLHLTHLIPPERLTEEYLTRLVEGIQFGGYVVEMSHHPHRAPPSINWWWWLKLGCDYLTKFGRKRRFYLAAKRAQRKASELYHSVPRDGQAGGETRRSTSALPGHH